MKEIRIMDIENIKIGSAENKEAGTGCTVIICERGAAAGLDVRGGGPASRESELLKPMAAADVIQAVLLSGGSAFPSVSDTNLFTGTIMDNIRYGRLEASDEECIAAARLANADGFIKRLPDGYNTVLHGGGANLSQGQRQLLAIARAAVADPPVLILDEATSSIDTRTERLVQKGMDALMSGRTSFVIAHRLSTVRNADCIMVMEQGRIIERGTHDQLMEEKGRYYQLYTGKSISA